jgi:hypothetical protein
LRIELAHEARAVALSPDGKLLATGDADGYGIYQGIDHAVRLWDLWTGKEVDQLRGHIGAVTDLAFSADGRVLVSASVDTTLLVWDASRFKRLDNAVRARSAEKLDALWADLASDDGLKAHQAIGELLAAGAAGANFLATKLEPAKVVEPGQIDRWLADLDNKDFAIRTRAAEQLEALGEQAEPGYRKLLDEQPSLEVRKRVDRLLERIRNGPTGEVLREIRAVETLERSGTPEARALLDRLADGAEPARLTQEARAAKERGR